MATSLEPPAGAEQQEAKPSAIDLGPAFANASMELGELRLGVLAWLLDSTDQPALAAKSVLERGAELPPELVALLREIATAEPARLQRRRRRRRSIN